MKSRQKKDFVLIIFLSISIVILTINIYLGFKKMIINNNHSKNLNYCFKINELSNFQFKRISLLDTSKQLSFYKNKIIPRE